MFYGNDDYMVVIDDYSILDIFCSDDIPFNSIKFLSFAGEWQLKTITPSPTYPQSNGLAEQTVGIANSKIDRGAKTFLQVCENMGIHQLDL
ncbi:hypothetical protein JTB14_001303 [Gonioctena quinquepunctata]|nr:hypothetical protein JTB14_001303 [Gonioctena quinquepunctata]